MAYPNSPLLHDDSKPPVLKDWVVIPYDQYGDGLDFLLEPPEHASFDFTARFYTTLCSKYLQFDGPRLNFKYSGSTYESCGLTLYGPETASIYLPWSYYYVNGCILVSTSKEFPKEIEYEHKNSFWKKMVEKWDNFLLQNYRLTPTP